MVDLKPQGMELYSGMTRNCWTIREVLIPTVYSVMLISFIRMVEKAHSHARAVGDLRHHRHDPLSRGLFCPLGNRLIAINRHCFPAERWFE